MVMWSAGVRLHGYHQLPYPIITTRMPKHWPAEVGRYWLQAQRNIEGSNWDAAALMARSALQLLLRRENASGNSLVKEIDDIASKGLIPPIRKTGRTSCACSVTTPLIRHRAMLAPLRRTRNRS